MQRSGRSLLERCDKLLQGIAAFTEAERDTAADQQPSPVSVVDSSSYLGEEGSPWPLAKRSIDFKGKRPFSLASCRDRGDVEQERLFFDRLRPPARRLITVHFLIFFEH